jgi:DNA-binding MarR family transcriptional regulator
LTEEDSGKPALGWLVSKAAAALNLRLSRAFADAGIAISPEQYGVLASASRRPGSSQAELARALGRDGPSLTRLTDGLARLGLVAREPREGDRRAYRLVVTSRGKDSLAAAERIVAREERFLAGVLAEGAVKATAEAMSRIIASCSGA